MPDDTFEFDLHPWRYQERADQMRALARQTVNDAGTRTLLIELAGEFDSLAVEASKRLNAVMALRARRPR